jgi:hypothetical protein
MAVTVRCRPSQEEPRDRSPGAALSFLVRPAAAPAGRHRTSRPPTCSYPPADRPAAPSPPYPAGSRRAARRTTGSRPGRARCPAALPAGHRAPTDGRNAPGSPAGCPKLARPGSNVSGWPGPPCQFAGSASAPSRATASPNCASSGSASGGGSKLCGRPATVTCPSGAVVPSGRAQQSDRRRQSPGPAAAPGRRRYAPPCPTGVSAGRTTTVGDARASLQRDCEAAARRPAAARSATGGAG